MNKYRWSPEDDYVCCREYLKYVFLDETPYCIDTLIERIHSKLPHISKGSIRKKIQNIKQVALESGLEDGFNIRPLVHYSKQCKVAFELAERDLEAIIENKKRPERNGTEYPIIAGGPELDEDIYSEVIPFHAHPEVLVGQEVTHRTFGKGKIVAIQGELIEVAFANKTAKFVYPCAFDCYLQFIDLSIQNKIAKYIVMYKRAEQRKASHLKYDPVEDTLYFWCIEEELEMLIEKRIGKNNHMGFCYYYWSTKKSILKEIYGIDWRSPAELNPRVCFD